MSFPFQKFGRARVFAAMAVIAPLALSSCLENAGVVTKAASTLSNSQANCLLPDTAAIRKISGQLAASSVVVGADFCAKPENYECYVRKFGPTLANGTSVVEETAHVADLGGNVTYRLKSQTYSTKDASRAPGVSASATLPGGEYNRSEYVCDELQLVTGGEFLAVGEGGTLAEALAAAYAKCSGVAPRLTVAQ